MKDIREEYDVSLRNSDKLGQGSFGTVRKAVKNGQEFAVKMITKESILKQNVFKKLLRDEMQILRHICHPKLPRVHALVEDRAHYSIVTEIFHGGNLCQHLNTYGPVPESQALTIVSQILSALQYLHSNKIVHRDIKLENIMFTTPYKPNKKQRIDVKLIDFGFATFQN